MSKRNDKLVRVYEMNGTKVDYVREVAINPRDKHQYLYVVKYVKWSDDRMYPYGYVAKVIEPAKNIISGQKVLQLMYQVPQMSDFHDHVPEINHESILLDRAKKRKNRCNDYVISIDPPGCKDIDDALSVKKCEQSEQFEVGIHIADVSNFVPIDTKLDQDAFKKRITFYPINEKTSDEISYMLPNAMTKYISLSENKERFAVSLFVTMYADGTICGQPRFEQTKIINKKEMTYVDAQLLIDNPERDPVVRNTLCTLLQLANAHRKKRLNEGFYHHELDKIDIQCNKQKDAHNLVEEFMIIANSCAADFISTEYREKTPICRQNAPSKEENKIWLSNHKDILTRCFYLPRFYGGLHSCTENELIKDDFVILEGTRNKMESSENVGDIIKLITTENLHPSYTVAFRDWLEMQNRSEIGFYTGTEADCHYNLRNEAYTWFTSPIRRYIDIVVHRMIIAILNRTPCPYSVETLTEICDKFNRSLHRQKKYTRDADILKTSLFLQSSPVFIPGVVTSYSDDFLEFTWPMLGKMGKNITHLPLSTFGLCDKPSFEDNSLKVHWQKRIYDDGNVVPHARKEEEENSNETMSIENLSDVFHVSSVKWENIIKKIQEGKAQQVLELSKSIAKLQTNTNINNCVTDVTSEMVNAKIIYHHVNFNKKIFLGSVVQTQLGAAFHKGFVRPQIQLYSVTPTVDLCIEHTKDPVSCFSEIAVHCNKDKYNSVHDYKETWLPMLSMEAACNTVNDGDPILINNVCIQLIKTKQSFCGTFELDWNFCTERQIVLFANNKDKNESMLEEEDEANDFICLRVPIKPSVDVIPEGRNDIKHVVTAKNMWTAHCVINPMKTYLNKDKDNDIKTVVVHFNVHQFSSTPPPYILKSENNTNGKRATIEILTKTLPNRRMEYAVNRLKHATEFCQKIVLGFPCENEQKLYSKIPNSLSIDVRKSKYKLFHNNETQEKALSCSMKQRFTLIQGPPGTGKTLTGVKLVYWFNKMNRSQDKSGCISRQVMYCGPSNSAVDVAARFLKSRLAEKCPKILRVYSEMLENQEFPLPRDAKIINSRGRRYEMGGRDDLTDISLHHLIRKQPTDDQEADRFARKIIYYDNKFAKTEPRYVSDEEVLAYQKLVTDASFHQIKKHEVILCTCSVSASPRMIKAAKVYQCIIDESGMCMEPETLIPLVSHRPEQVVLIGDHKQLRPIVTNKIAKDLGLEKSMFERQASIIRKTYSESSSSSRLIMLDTQYRMHEKICAFPSDHFYKGKLKTQETMYWKGDPLPIWPNPTAPMVFCHVEGIEEGLSISSYEGGQSSKSNREEMEHAVRIFLYFVQVLKVKPHTIAILSQYRSQCHKIKTVLEEEGIKNPNVHTVVASQGGEWDYVILSTVRSLPEYELDKRASYGWKIRNLGFIIDHHQINVALTRGRKGLVIIGNKNLLVCDSGEDGLWDKLLKHYEKNGAIVNAGDFLIRPEKSERKRQSVQNQKHK